VTAPRARTRASYRPGDRLREPAAFRRAFERRKTASDAAMVVYAVENNQAAPRLGISLGKKKVKKASRRNRIKRLIREAFRLHRVTLPRGVDLVVVPRGPDLDFATVMTSFPRLARDAARRLGHRPPPSSRP
jgi:ribonuclease P protein component